MSEQPGEDRGYLQGLLSKIRSAAVPAAANPNRDAPSRSPGADAQAPAPRLGPPRSATIRILRHPLEARPGKGLTYIVILCIRESAMRFRKPWRTMALKT